MSQKRHFIPELEGFAPVAAGLADEDIAQVLALVRTVTPEKILEIRSDHEGATVQTGFLANGECGEGHWFEFAKSGDGWALVKTGEWIA